MNLRRPRVVAVFAVLASLTAAPAQAHHGYAGPVRLYLDTVRMEPEANGWALRAALHDGGNGRPAPGFVVHASGTGSGGSSFGPVTLLDSGGDGHYAAALGPIPAGDWSLSLDVADAPGASERAIPLKRTWSITLAPGQPLDVLGKLAPPSDTPSESGSPLPLILGAAAGFLGLALVARQFARHRGSASAAGAS